MRKPVSIIIPVYNVEQYLDKCMKSIVNQTYTDLEIILVDDGSNDGSEAKCDNWGKKDNRVKVIHKENGGLSDARNVGISNASSEYLMFVDSDDVVSTHIVEYLLDLLMKTDSDISICDPIHCFPGTLIEFKDESDVCVYSKEEALAEMLYQKSFLASAWGKMYKAKLFENVMFPKGMLYEDVAIMYRLFDSSKTISYGNAQYYGYMHREGSITTKKFSEKDCDILKISNDIEKYMTSRGKELIEAARAYNVTAHLRVFISAFPEKQYQGLIRQCQNYIYRNWINVFLDKNIRIKLRISLLIFLTGRKNLIRIHSRVNRWS